MGKGVFISLEGVDGSGKTSLLEEIQSKNLPNVSTFKTLSTNEEYSNQFGCMARNSLKEKKFDSKTFALLCILDMHKLYHDHIKPLLNAGVDVYVDRWYHSTITYFAEANNSNERNILSFTNFLVQVLKLPSPDIVAFLFCDFSISMDRIKSRGNKMDKLEKKMNTTKLARLAGIYYYVLQNSHTPTFYLNTGRTKTVDDAHYLFELKLKDHLAFYYGI
ncbi:MAG: dTMP kinase [Brevinema sp.]